MKPETATVVYVCLAAWSLLIGVLCSFTPAGPVALALGCAFAVQCLVIAFINERSHRKEQRQ
jgi:hypothetical protein